MATSLIPVRQAELWTKKGLGRLGFLIRQARLELGWSMDRLALAVYHKTGEQIAKKTIGNIENNVGFPQYNSLAAIAVGCGKWEVGSGVWGVGRINKIISYLLTPIS